MARLGQVAIEEERKKNSSKIARLAFFGKLEKIVHKTTTPELTIKAAAMVLIRSHFAFGSRLPH